MARSSAAKRAAAPARRKRARADSGASDPSADDLDAAADELVEKVRRSGGRRGAKRKAAGATILAEFASLDALLENDEEEQRRKQEHARRMQQLRAESAEAADGSALGRLVVDMEANMTSLAADSDLFATAELPLNEEKFGYVFQPMTEPLAFRPYSATDAELRGDLALVYQAMQSHDDSEIAGLLWTKAILIRCLLGKHDFLPTKIGSWLFTTMSTHSDNYIVSGCYNNLFLVLTSNKSYPPQKLGAALPSGSFTAPIEDFRSLFGQDAGELIMEWKPSVYDFLNAFRAYGFQESKRSMIVKSKIATTPTSKSGKPALPFPTVNMRYVLMFMIVSLRTKLLHLDPYDAFSFTMFFLRMQFESGMHPAIVELATICIEELLDAIPPTDWRKEWAPAIVLRIAGVKEGLFGSADGWLTVARRLPRTNRGTQLTTGLSIYVLQHRIDKEYEEGASSERPMKFPIQSGLVLDIVAGIVETLTAQYVEKKRKEGKASKKSAPPFDLLCKKVALMDLALQAFLNVLSHKEMSVMLSKLDALATAHKSTMSAKWHELKTLVSLMHRKYSRDNLRIGRSSSPPAKTVLFCDDD